mmetsp:Transcript_47658/g.93075  ORF Transcript_47658/g.93075 Transcript_47658/m.93075 type:complete len:246 (-) Transcript_47658:173-910(-)
MVTPLLIMALSAALMARMGAFTERRTRLASATASMVASSSASPAPSSRRTSLHSCSAAWNSCWNCTTTCDGTPCTGLCHSATKISSHSTSSGISRSMRDHTGSSSRAAPGTASAPAALLSGDGGGGSYRPSPHTLLTNMRKAWHSSRVIMSFRPSSYLTQTSRRVANSGRFSGTTPRSSNSERLTKSQASGPVYGSAFDAALERPSAHFLGEHSMVHDCSLPMVACRRRERGERCGALPIALFFL